ncbi:MAG: acetyl-CoA carboxylase biotin carboxylase subunit [Longimicrobiales bacterium]|nr:acetyl-CoA carboxylase biotin carboxylase subunit [Longimicrobiales bacterium]
MFEKVLVANRGEIAIRILRAAREMGIRTVAVYSEADRAAPHLRFADEAIEIGPAASAESYLRIDRILEAAARTGAEAIHPGYGFLAERAEFARAVEDAGLVFVGPSPETIEAMGDKTAARRRMDAAGVPIVPGIVDPARTAADALEAAREIGFPVLLKAAAGGGGKGMRVVETPDAVERAFEAAGREALAAFGDDAVYVERYLARPRHIEIQVLGDAHGQVVHLGERECSLQRRHQKLVEEAPSAVLDSGARAAMGDAAVRAAAAVNYRGAGTIEFLWEDGEFWFLEMNTRLQVEHPVTELVTGIDLVQWQFRVAAGEALSFEQDDVRFDGHAIECRITAEDPDGGFLPSTGRIGHLRLPEGAGVRWDGAIAEGYEVGLHYDPLLGKLIVHAPDRTLAIDRMARALDEFELTGVAHAAPFHRRVMRHEAFRAGDLSIRFLEEHPDLTSPAAPDEDLALAAAVSAILLEEDRRTSASPRRLARDGGGVDLGSWRGAGHPGLGGGW